MTDSTLDRIREDKDSLPNEDARICAFRIVLSDNGINGNKTCYIGTIQFRNDIIVVSDVIRLSVVDTYSKNLIGGIGDCVASLR